MGYDYVTSRRLQLQQNGFALSKIRGKSMRPLIWGGQHCVAVVPLDGEPAVGDLLAFMQVRDGEEISIVHRLVEIRPVGDSYLYVTRGDNCFGCEQVRPEEIIGRVAEVHRLSGFRLWHIIPAKRFAVTDRAYLWYSRLWMATWPVRRFYFQFRARVYGVYVRLRKFFKSK